MQSTMTRLAFILAMIFTANWQEAETVDVEDRGPVDLRAFDCHDITRSSVISRVCYDAENRRMLVERHAVYRQYLRSAKGHARCVPERVLDGPVLQHKHQTDGR